MISKSQRRRLRVMAKEKPISFTAPMVRAILESRKTMTRRVIREASSGWPEWDVVGGKLWYDDNPWVEVACPYGTSGDLCWVKEPWAVARKYNRMRPSRLPPNAKVHYIADGPKPRGFGRTRNTRFIMKRFSRITLEITGVRVERVQDISEWDAEAEGAERGFMDGPNFEPSDDSRCGFRTGFRIIWDSIHEKRGFGWETNPWVWAISFRRVEP